MNELESLALCPEYLTAQYQWKGTVHFLTEVKRQEDGSEIMRNAITLRKAIESDKTHVDLLGFKFKNGFNAVTDYTQQYLERGHEHCVSIACSHKQNIWFNGEVRKNIFRTGADLIEKSDLMLVTQKWGRNGMHLYSGDHVIVEDVVMNKIEVVAGLHFVPVKLKSKSLDGKEEMIEDYLMLESINYPSGQLLIAQEKGLRHERYAKNTIFRESGFPSDDRYVGAIRLTYGHSITCNKAQGGEWEKVYMNAFMLPSLKYQYTAVTRAKTSLVRY